MKITLSRATLIKPLQMISGVVEKRQTLPILSNVLVTVNEDTLSLTATDLEIELIGSVKLEQPVAQAGATTVAARKLLDICRALPDDASIQMTLDGEQLIVRSAGSRFALTTLPATDFPNVENGPFITQFKMSQAKLRKLIGKTHFAMGQQDVRHYLNGTLFDIGDGVVKCIATDGHRLAYSFANEVNTDGAKIKAILPRKTVLELIRLLDANSEDEITVCFGESHFRIVTNDFIFTSKLINAQYPDYDKLIPRSVVNTAVASREALRQALVRAAILSNEKFRGIRLHLNEDQLRIVANNPEQEEAEEMVTLNYQGAGLEVGFNAAYLLDVVSAIGSDDISWSFNDPNSGVLIEPTAGEHGDCLYVVMPMRL
jgi:DNA polymerase-3 subunit beta